jgi:type VI secretion system protein ImpK
MKNHELKTPHTQRQSKQSLIDICADCFTLILQLRNTSEYGDQDILRRRIRELLNKVEHEAREIGFDENDIQMAIFALVAFLDETIIASDWKHKSTWLATPLQLELFDRFDAGEEFFSRLEILRQKSSYKRDILEIYYLCMTLGFKGKYQFQQREKLHQFIEESYDYLRHLKGKSAEILSPHGKRRDEFVDVVSREVPVWIIGASAVAIGFIFYVIMNLLISNAATRVIRLISSIV